MITNINTANENRADAKMSHIAAAAEAALAAPFLKIRANDNLMSTVAIHGSFDPVDAWENNIFHNSRYFIFHITPAKGRRWYDPATDTTVTVELISSGIRWTAAKFRKYTGSPDKAIAKIAAWMAANA